MRQLFNTAEEQSGDSGVSRPRREMVEIARRKGFQNARTTGIT